MSAAADWIDEFDGFLSSDVKLESDILNIEEPNEHISWQQPVCALSGDATSESDILEIDEANEHDCGPNGANTDRENLADFVSSTFKDFQEESSMCCVCWEPFLNEKQTRLVYLEKKQVLLPFALPCLHLGHIHCLKKLVSMRCTQKCCGRCAALIPEQLFGMYMGIATVVFAYVALTIEFAGIIADKEKKLASGFLKMESAVFETIGLKKKL
jgi:hypothetical protein